MMTNDPGPKNSPVHPRERHVDDDLTPHSEPDQPNRIDPRSPAEVANDDHPLGDDEPPGIGPPP